MDDDMNAIIIGSTGGLIGLAIWAWILYSIIKEASQGKKIFPEQEM